MGSNEYKGGGNKQVKELLWPDFLRLLTLQCVE